MGRVMGVWGTIPSCAAGSDDNFLTGCGVAGSAGRRVSTLLIVPRTWRDRLILLAAAVVPGVIALSGRVRMLVRLSGAPQHLQLAGPAGPVLVPAEQSDRLFQIALPSGAVIADARVGRQPQHGDGSPATRRSLTPANSPKTTPWMDVNPNRR